MVVCKVHRRPFRLPKGVDRSGVRKTARLAVSVPNNGAGVVDFSKLRKMVPQASGEVRKTEKKTSRRHHRTFQ
jgi:hypothetical protein